MYGIALLAYEAASRGGDDFSQLGREHGNIRERFPGERTPEKLLRMVYERLVGENRIPDIRPDNEDVRKIGVVYNINIRKSGFQMSHFRYPERMRQVNFSMTHPLNPPLPSEPDLRLDREGDS